MELTTICYLEENGCYLMIHRTKKKNDINQDKWIGPGGHVEKGESPEECIQREMREECGITLADPALRGIITFVSDTCGEIYIFLFTATRHEGTLNSDCAEGFLKWVPKAQLPELSLWEGDRIFLDLLEQRRDFFSLKLCYRGDTLTEAALDGRSLSLPWKGTGAGA